MHREVPKAPPESGSFLFSEFVLDATTFLGTILWNDRISGDEP